MSGWKKQTLLLWFASPRAFVPSRECFLSFSPELSSLWTDTSCSPLAWMSVWLMDVWPCCSPALHQLLIKQGHSPVWMLPWLLSSKVRLYQQLDLIFMCSSPLLIFGMSKYFCGSFSAPFDFISGLFLFFHLSTKVSCNMRLLIYIFRPCFIMSFALNPPVQVLCERLTSRWHHMTL